MPSRPCRPLPPKRSDPRRAGAAVLALLLLAGCATAPRRPSGADDGAGAAASVLRRERPYLLDPTAGYPLALDARRGTELRAAHQALVAGGAPDSALSLARDLLVADPALHPAAVLASQADLVAGRLRDAADRLAPVVGQLPDYVAAGLLAGRAAELLGELPEAYAAYRSVDLELALTRARELHPRALEIVANRLDDALARGHLEAAERQLQRLEAWGPDATVTLEGARQVAAARGDGAAELAAVARLAERFSGQEDLLRRQGELELDFGDVGRGLAIFRDLAARHPQDPGLAEQLEQAKFRWRLELLPAEARAAASRPALSRGDFAVLLYWLVPGVRYGRSERAVIANDILDDPRREQIARVVNLGLMGVDPVLHRFSPDRELARSAALGALLAAVATAGAAPPACVGPLPPAPAAAPDAICAAAARCRLIAGTADCLPEAPVAGAEALALLRRALELL